MLLRSKYKYWWKVSIAIVLVWMLVGSLSACGREEQPGTYSDDGYMGMTQTNPHLPTNPTHRSYYEDTQVVKRTLQSIEGIKQVQTYANGQNVVVYLQLEDGLTSKERDAIRHHAEKALSYNNPRFDYAVRIQQ